MHIMMDIETLGTGNDALILSIGAVKFEPNPFVACGLDALGERFYVAIDPVSAFKGGGKIDPETVLWWMHKDRTAARDALLADDKVDLGSALEGFAMWLGESAPVWGNGATFDNVIVRRAYERLGMECPWKFYHDRCHRTIKSLNHHINLKRDGGIHHNALDDAIYQAHHLSLIAHEINIILR